MKNLFLDYLQQLNDTGSFPDESDKTPMVFNLFLCINSGLNKNNQISVLFTMLSWKGWNFN